MKVKNITATPDTVMIELESEHPAEDALCNLLTGCEATTDSITPEPDSESKHFGIVIVASMKKKLGLY